MNKNDAEAVIKETIEYANREIEITKKKARRNNIIVISCLVLLIAAGVGAIVNHNLKDNSNMQKAKTIILESPGIIADLIKIVFGY